jgi:hypothetical protein
VPFAAGKLRLLLSLSLFWDPDDLVVGRCTMSARTAERLLAAVAAADTAAAAAAASAAVLLGHVLLSLPGCSAARLACERIRTPCAHSFIHALPLRQRITLVVHCALACCATVLNRSQCRSISEHM